MEMKISEMSEDVRRYLGMLIEEDVEKNRDHLRWLGENPQEPDRDLQFAQSERAVALGRLAQVFPSTDLAGGGAAAASRGRNPPTGVRLPRFGPLAGPSFPGSQSSGPR